MRKKKGRDFMRPLGTLRRLLVSPSNYFGVVVPAGGVVGLVAGAVGLVAAGLAAAGGEPRRLSIVSINHGLGDINRLTGPDHLALGPLFGWCRARVQNRYQPRTSPSPGPSFAECARMLPTITKPENEVASRILQKMGPVMVKYAADSGFWTLARHHQTVAEGQVIWAGQTVDITKAVVDAYNAQSGVAAPPAAARPALPSQQPPATKPTTPPAGTTTPK